jgi:hypothetical protein
MVRKGNYGPVLVLRGRHKGKVAYYDDDDNTRPGNTSGRDEAVVYVGEPFASDPIYVKYRDLARVDVKSVQLERWERQYPRLVKSSTAGRRSRAGCAVAPPLPRT